MSYKTTCQVYMNATQWWTCEQYEEVYLEPNVDMQSHMLVIYHIQWYKSHIYGSSSLLGAKEDQQKKELLSQVHGIHLSENNKNRGHL